MLQKFMADAITFAGQEREEGQGLVEYALILVLVSVVAAAVLLLVGDEVVAVFSDIVTALSGSSA